MKSLGSRNEIVVGDEVLLVVEAGGYRSHLVRRSHDPQQTAHPAVNAEKIEASLTLPTGGARNYDMGALTEPVWHRKTLCGVNWYVMAATDSGPLTSWQEPTYAPDCKRCLRCVSRELVSTSVDPRVNLAAMAAAEFIEQRGYATVDDIPGDQVEHFRHAVREACRVLRVHCVTHVDINGTVHVNSGHLRDAMSDLQQMEALHSALEDRSWQLSWRTWPTF